jgi:hypothetical protein
VYGNRLDRPTLGFVRWSLSPEGRSCHAMKLNRVSCWREGELKQIGFEGNMTVAGVLITARFESHLGSCHLPDCWSRVCRCRLICSGEQHLRFELTMFSSGRQGRYLYLGFIGQMCVVKDLNQESFRCHYCDYKHSQKYL